LNDLGVHILLFVITGIVIVVISAMYSEPDDGRMFRMVPKRLLYFFGGCAAVALVMLLLEHTLASVS